MIGVYIFVMVGFFIATLALLTKFDDDALMFFTPKYIYDITEMNIFGCIICSLIIIILNPIYCIIAIVVWSIWKLFHIGRKDL